MRSLKDGGERRWWSRIVDHEDVWAEIVVDDFNEDEEDWGFTDDNVDDEEDARDVGGCCCCCCCGCGGGGGGGGGVGDNDFKNGANIPESSDILVSEGVGDCWARQARAKAWKSNL